MGSDRRGVADRRGVTDGEWLIDGEWLTDGKPIFAYLQIGSNNLKGAYWLAKILPPS